MGHDAGHAPAGGAGAHVRPPHAARAQRHRRDPAAERRRHGLLQVGPPARARRPVAHHRRDGHDHGRRADADRPHPARRLRRAARLLGHRRRRDLRRGLRDRLRPQPAAQPGARQRARRRDRHPRRARHPAPPRPLRVRAVGRRAARGHAPAGPRAAAGRRQGPPGAARPRHLPGRDQPLVRPLPARHAAVRARRHLRAQRRQGAVPRPGRRGGDPERAVPRRGARPPRQRPRRRRLRGHAPAQRPGDEHDDEPLRAVPDRRLGRAAEGPRAVGGGQLPLLRRDGCRTAARRPRRSPRDRRPRTSCSSTARARRPARRSSSAVRRSVTTTPA